jgi:hypothetical protein
MMINSSDKCTVGLTISGVSSGFSSSFSEKQVQVTNLKSISNGFQTTLTTTTTIKKDVENGGEPLKS